MICILEQYTNTGTEASNLGLLHFPHSSLNSCITYGQHHIAHCLLMQSSIVWCPNRLEAPYVTGTTLLTLIMHNAFYRVAVFTCIHSSTHSPYVPEFILHICWGDGLHKIFTFIGFKFKWDGTVKKKKKRKTRKIQEIKITVEKIKL